MVRIDILFKTDSSKLPQVAEPYKLDLIVVFGSYAKGTATADSDIDLLVISESKERFYERQASVRRLLRDLIKRIPLSPIVLTHKELEYRKKLGDQFINEILETGIRA